MEIIILYGCVWILTFSPEASGLSDQFTARFGLETGFIKNSSILDYLLLNFTLNLSIKSGVKGVISYPTQVLSIFQNSLKAKKS